MADFLKDNFPSMRNKVIKKITGSAAGEKEIRQLDSMINNQLRKEITGAAIGEEELELLKSVLPKK